MFHPRLKMWFKQWLWHKPDPSHTEETVALPEFHTGKVHHTEAHAPQEEPIHYDNVAIPEVHLPHKNK